MTASAADPPAAAGLDTYRLFRRLVPPELLDQRQPAAPQAVYTPFVTVWLLLHQRLAGGATLNDAVDALLFSFPPEDLPRCKRTADDSVSANSGAYAKARLRLDKGLAEWLADHVHGSLAASCSPSWRGRRVQLLDGTTFSLAPSRDLRLAFPPATNQYGPSHWPVLQVVVAHDLDSGLACRPEYGPMYGDLAEGEAALARRLLPRLAPASLLLADGNFGIFIVAYEAVRAGHDVLLRLSRKRFKALLRQAEPAGDGRWALTWRPAAQERKKYGLAEGECVRGFLAALPGGQAQGQGKQEALYLFSTLAEGTNLEWGQLYGRRWGVETDIGSGKEALGLGEVRGKTAAMVEKEVVLATVAYNLVVQVRRLAAQQAQVQPRRLSFTATAGLVNAFGAKVASACLSEVQLHREFARLLRAVGQRKLPQRPGRQWPREVIPRRQRYDARKRCPAELASPGSGAFDYPHRQ